MVYLEDEELVALFERSMEVSGEEVVMISLTLLGEVSCFV